MSASQVITRMFGNLVAAAQTNILDDLQVVDPNITGIRYDYGHWVELTERLRQINDNPKQSVKKQSNNPMVLLVEDFPISVGNTGYFGTGTFTILILKNTEAGLTSSERETRNFIPFLNPIYDELMNQILHSSYFVASYPISHTITDRKFLGRVGLYGNQGNIMNDYMDAKEISNLRLIIADINCLTPINLS